MSGGRVRSLDEAQVRRVLASGGILVEAGGEWRVHRSADARLRAAGRITPLIANRLRSLAVVHPDPDRPGRWLATRPLAAPAPEAVPLPAWLSPARRHVQPVSLLAAILGSPDSDPGERVRLKAAAQRFLADITLAGSAVAPSRMAPGKHPQAALERLSALEASIGLETFRQLESLIAGRAGASHFAKDYGYGSTETASAGALEALRMLARAYDLARR